MENLMNTRTAVSWLACLLLLQALASGQKPPAPPAFDFSGRYSFLQDGEDIQIDLTGTRVDGWVTRLGQTPSDDGLLLQHFFSQASVDGDRFSFTTRPVHGIWYEFQGTVARGPAKTKAEDGYYVVTGTLREHKQKENKEVSVRTRQATFQSFGEEPEEEPGAARKK